MCGEKSGFCQRSILHLGSPPRMRGKAIVIQRVDRLGGITPACAGKRTPLLTPRSVTWDHPRVCGEKGVYALSSQYATGSPPRMRGKGVVQRQIALVVGITPACAGKSRRLYRAIGCSKGSPPRMRGKVLHQRPELCSHGITPACAGKRHCPRSRPGRIRDHPRVCGEKTPDASSTTKSIGSPPRMRGKAIVIQRVDRLGGITPACAGKSYTQNWLAEIV